MNWKEGRLVIEDVWGTEHGWVKELCDGSFHPLDDGQEMYFSYEEFVFAGKKNWTSSLIYSITNINFYSPVGT